MAAPTPGRGRVQAAGKQGTEDLLLRNKQSQRENFPGGRLAPALRPALSREGGSAVPRGPGRPRAAAQSHGSSRPVALLRAACFLWSQRQEGKERAHPSSGAHTPPPPPSGTLGSGSPHPAGVSQRLRAEGAAWLGTHPAQKGTPSLPGEGRCRPHSASRWGWASQTRWSSCKPARWSLLSGGEGDSEGHPLGHTGQQVGREASTKHPALPVPQLPPPRRPVRRLPAAPGVARASHSAWPGPAFNRKTGWCTWSSQGCGGKLRPVPATQTLQR